MTCRKIALKIESFALKMNLISVGKHIFFHEKIVSAIYFDLAAKIDEFLAIFILLGASNTPKNGLKSGAPPTFYPIEPHIVS